MADGAGNRGGWWSDCNVALTLGTGKRLESGCFLPNSRFSILKRAVGVRAKTIECFVQCTDDVLE